MDAVQKFSVPIAIIVAGALIGGGLYFSHQSSGGTPSTPQAPSVNIKDVKVTADDPFIGNQNAPVTIAYWSDYQCPYCKAVEVGGIPQIPVAPALPDVIKQYVDTGKVKIVFKDYPFLGNDSITGALYEHAVWEMYPDKFYDWRDAMFKAQDQEGDTGFGNEASILKLIKTIPGLDAGKLQALVAQKKDAYTAIMNADRDEGTKLGITGTPAFIIGKTLIAGAEPLASFTAAIDAQLK